MWVSIRLMAVYAALFLGIPLPRACLTHEPAKTGYPDKTIRLIVGFAAGGGNDIIARILGQKLQESLGQTVVVENRVGAGGRLSAEYVAGQPADGYTLLIGSSGAMAIGPAVIEKVLYGTLRDFAPISMIASFPLIM